MIIELLLLQGGMRSAPKLPLEFFIASSARDLLVSVAGRMGTMTLERGVAGGVSQAGNHASVAKKGDFKTCTLQ